jgi:type I restriction enzyme S subunit
MNPDLLLAHFDRISDVPDAIPRLRRFILDLAVRGKLVEQNPTDEPASELLKRILAEKRRLVEVGKSKPDTLSPIGPSEIPFDVPLSWTWIRVGSGFQYDAGIKRQPRELQPGKWLLELEDIEKDTSVVLTRLKVQDRESQSTKSEFREGDILYGKLRPYLNKVVIADVDGYSTTEIVAIRPFIPMNPSYCSLAFRSPDFVRYVSRVGQGTKMPRLRTQDALVALFPLPPLSEQGRISAKVEELMALCDRVEAAQRRREDHRDRVVALSHYQLTNRANAKDLQTHVSFYLNNLSRLTTTSKQISTLRQTILDLAVRGRLSHDVSLPPTQAAKDTPTTDMDFPAHWSVQPLTKVAASIVDCPHSTPKWTTEGKICVRTNQFRPGRLDLSDARFVSESTYLERIQRLEPHEDDILYSREGGILGVACRVPANIQLCLGQRMMLIRPGPRLDAAFLEIILNSPYITRTAAAKTTGGAAPRINVATVKAYLIPLPPPIEQRSIVAKVNVLMALCDQLETALAATRSEGRRLLESFLFDALSDKPAIDQIYAVQA